MTNASMSKDYSWQRSKLLTCLAEQQCSAQCPARLLKGPDCGRPPGPRPSSGSGPGHCQCPRAGGQWQVAPTPHCPCLPARQSADSVFESHLFTFQALSRESKVQACLRADAHSHALLKQYVFIQEMLASLVIQQTRQ